MLEPKLAAVIRRAAFMAVLLVTALASPKLAHAQECVDINTASSVQLQRIIHIGPERAGQIIQLRGQRRFASVDDLARVRGIAAARIRDIKAQGLACVRELGVYEVQAVSAGYVP